MGRIIPAGTGFLKYRSYDMVTKDKIIPEAIEQAPESEQAV